MNLSANALILKRLDQYETSPPGNVERWENILFFDRPGRACYCLRFVVWVPGICQGLAGKSRKGATIHIKGKNDKKMQKSILYV